MKLIIAIIKPHRLSAVQEALTDLDIAGMTISEVQGFGRQKGHKEIYRGAEYEISFVPKVKIELVCADESVDGAVEAITAAAKVGSIGDGKIFVLGAENAVRIRTGESGNDAL